MSAVDLVFDAIREPPTPLDLVFDGPGTPGGLMIVTIDPLVIALELDVGDRGYLKAFMGCPWVYASTVVPPSGDAGWNGATVLNVDYETLWATGQPLQLIAQEPWSSGIPTVGYTTDPWQQGIGVGYKMAAPWADCLTGINAPNTYSWRQALGFPKEPLDLPWQQGLTMTHQWMVAWRDGAYARVARRLGWREGALNFGQSRLPWRQGVFVVSYGGPPLVIPGPEDPVCYISSTDLVLDKLYSTSFNLLFECDYGGEPRFHALVVVPIQEVYFVANTIELRKITGDVLLLCTALSMTLDSDSWTWTFQATVGGDDITHFTPGGGPVALEAIINGEHFRLVAESVSRNRTFGKASLSISGRGRNAELATPTTKIYSFTNTGDRDATQLMDEVLMENAVPIGWDVNFGMTDWLVPTGLWQFRGTRMEALQRIAAAAGGYIQPHPTAQTVNVRHRYPVAPWNWGSVTPDIELPSSVVTVENIKWENKPSYNRVYVSGESQGKNCEVTITGSGGTLVAPGVVDSLISVAAAGLQRGRAILGDTGAQAIMDLRLPILDTTGVIVPGKFVRYFDGTIYRLGIVRRVSVVAGLKDSWQTLGVESHV